MGNHPEGRTQNPRTPIGYCPHEVVMMMMKVMIIMVVKLVIKMELMLMMRDEEVRVRIQVLGERQREKGVRCRRLR